MTHGCGGRARARLPPAPKASGPAAGRRSLDHWGGSDISSKSLPLPPSGRRRAGRKRPGHGVTVVRGRIRRGTKPGPPTNQSLCPKHRCSLPPELLLRSVQKLDATPRPKLPGTQDVRRLTAAPLNRRSNMWRNRDVPRTCVRPPAERRTNPNQQTCCLIGPCVTEQHQLWAFRSGGGSHHACRFRPRRVSIPRG